MIKNEAATKIQANFKGVQARKKVKAEFGFEATKSADSDSRKRSSEATNAAK